MTQIKEQIESIISSGRCMGLSMLKNEIGGSELDICKNIKDATILKSEKFDEVWSFLTSFKLLTLFIENKGNIFELPVKVGPGKDGMGYFNLMTKGCLNGHLKKESIKNIVLLKLPFMHLTSYQIAFLGDDGNSIYNFYLSRNNHEISSEDILAFVTFANEVKQ